MLCYQGGSDADGDSPATFFSARRFVSRALLAALASVPEQRAAVRQQLAVRVKRMVDLRIELERPFEHSDRLADLLARQRGLKQKLDLD